MQALAAWSDFLRARERFDEERAAEAEEAMEKAWRTFCDARARENPIDRRHLIVGAG